MILTGAIIDHFSLSLSRLTLVCHPLRGRNGVLKLPERLLLGSLFRMTSDLEAFLASHLLNGGPTRRKVLLSGRKASLDYLHRLAFPLVVVLMLLCLLLLWIKVRNECLMLRDWWPMLQSTTIWQL